MRLLPVLLLSAVACTSGGGAPVAVPSPSVTPPSASPAPTRTPSPSRPASVTPSRTPSPAPSVRPTTTAPRPPVATTPAPVRLAVPATFVAVARKRLGLYSSGSGALVRWLTPQTRDIGLPALSPDKRTVYFVEMPGSGCPGTYRMALSGGPRTLVRAGQDGGAQPIAVGPGLAGHTACVATMRITWTKGAASGYFNGTRSTGANGLAWSPDGSRIAVSTSTQVRVVPLTSTDVGSGAVPPCPFSLPGCRTRSPAYGPDGSLYYVAVALDSSRAEVVRQRGNVATTVFRLPAVSAAYRLFAAPSGALLVSGDSDNDAAASDFAMTWDGVTARSIGRAFVQPAW